MARFHPPMAPWYVDYLASPHWITLREALRTQRGFICEDCKSDFRVVLHHITYARLGHERHADLRFLCSRCHRRAHKRHNIPYLFLIYRPEYTTQVLPILRSARLTHDFTYPHYR